MRRVLFIESAIILAGGFLLNCSAQGQPAPQQPPKNPVSLSPAMPVAPVDPAKMAGPASGTPQRIVDVDVTTFVLGAEDQISVTMWEEPGLGGTFTIRPDGMFSLPLIGEIKAAGRTPVQLQEDINKAALTQLTTPRSTVNVIGVHSKHLYFDGGGIAQPGAMDLVTPIHLLEAISARGGTKEFADTKHIRILRDGKLLMIVNYKDLTSGKHPEKNILLLDNDHVIVRD
jgi:polysaccharide export outer membrane protein